MTLAEELRVLRAVQLASCPRGCRSQVWAENQGTATQLVKIPAGTGRLVTYEKTLCL